MTAATLVSRQVTNANELVHSIDTEDLEQYAFDLRKAYNALINDLKQVDGGDPNIPQVPPPPPQ